MKKFFLFFLFPPLLQVAFLFATDLPLRFGMELTYPPFEMVCPNGEPCGISVDLIEAFGKFAGRKTEILSIPFIGLIPSLKNRKIDAIVSSLTITEQRKKVIDFSDPYATTGLCMLLNINTKVKNIEDANQEGRVIVVKSGTTGELYAKQHLQKATVRVLDSEAACVLEVIQDKADAFLYDQLSVFTHWKKNPTSLKANLIPFQKEYWAFGVRKNNPKLLEQINQFLKKFREEGGFDKLAEKYLPEQKAGFRKMGIPFVF
jgi:polar amino acid transport system substrate-binding protein